MIPQSQRLVHYLKKNEKNNKAIITFGWIYLMGFVEQSVQEVVRWKCGMREKTIQPRCARGTAPLSAASAPSFPVGAGQNLPVQLLPLLSNSSLKKAAVGCHPVRIIGEFAGNARTRSWVNLTGESVIAENRGDRLNFRAMSFFRLIAFLSLGLLAACGSERNDPYPAGERGQNILYSAFTERPKHLDPAQSYTEDEATFTAQIYEPPLQYHYLKRPYELIPATVDRSGRAHV